MTKRKKVDDSRSLPPSKKQKDSSLLRNPPPTTCVRSEKLWNRVVTLECLEAIRCQKSLDTSLALGFNTDFLPDHYKRNIVARVVQTKKDYPDAIVLVKNGLFFNGVGIDAILCMEYCPLMSRQNTANIGARVEKIQQIIHQLLAEDLEIVLVEKGPGKEYTNQLMDKFNPIYFGSDIVQTVDVDIPVHLAVFVSLDSVDMYVINDIVQDIDVYQNINITTLPLLVALYPARQLYVMGSKTSLSFACLEFIHLSWSCDRNDFLETFLSHQFKSSKPYQIQVRSNIVQRCTVEQLGLLPTLSIRGVPSLLNAVCPGVGKKCSQMVSKQLICPPDLSVSERFRTLVRKYPMVETAMPLPPSKILSLNSAILMLRKRKASASYLRGVYQHLEWFSKLMCYESEAGPADDIFTGMELICFSSLVSQCVFPAKRIALNCRLIEDAIGVQKHLISKCDMIRPPIESVMASSCEKWHGHVSVKASMLFNSKVMKARRAYMKAIPQSLLAKCEWWPDGQRFLTKIKLCVEGTLAVDKNQHYLRGKFKNYYTVPLMRMERKYYLRCCDDAQLQADQILHELNVHICEKVLTFVENVWCWNHIIQTHVATTLPKKWTVAQIVDSTNPVLKLTDFRPFWMGSSAVPNDFNLNSMVALTGGNMGGKSTVCRSVAGIALLAKTGYLVPSSSCQVSQNLNVFLNVGNADCMMNNLSGFGAEAADMASLFQMTANNQHVLAICDEIAAGTSNVEGSALAIAYITALLKTNTIGFVSTHFDTVLVSPELVQLSKQQMQRENGQFTYRIIPGICSHRYATETARKVGVPESICQHADNIIAKSSGIVVDQYSEWNAVDILVEALGDYALVLEKNHQCPVVCSSCLYLLKCDSGFVYIGESDDLAKRFTTHFASEKRPSQMYVWKMKSKSEARRKETEMTAILKRKGVLLISSCDGNHTHFGSS